jgi:cell division protein FtsZ
LLVICNDRLREMYGNLNLSNAFAQADDVLATAAKGIAEVITVTGQINVDFKDVNTVMKDSGVAILGSSQAQGEDRAIQAVDKALSSPLLNDNDISGAQNVLLNITYGDQEVLMDEISEITDRIQEEAGATADVIWGHGYDPSLEEDLGVTIIATGFKAGPSTGSQLDHQMKEQQKRYVNLEEEEEGPATEGTDEQGAEEAKEEQGVKSEDEPYRKGAGPGRTETASSPSLFQESDEQPKGRRFHLDEEEGADRPEEGTDPTASGEKKETPTPGPKAEEANEERRAAERMSRIREMTMKLRSHSRISELEKEPAYRRKNIQLEDPPSSDESEVSRYSLSNDENDEEERPGIRKNNSYLHDKPD